MKSSDSNNRIDRAAAPACTPTVISRLRRVIDMSEIKDTGTKSANGKPKPHTAKKQQDRPESHFRDRQKKRPKCTPEQKQNTSPAHATKAAQPSPEPAQPAIPEVQTTGIETAQTRTPPKAAQLKVKKILKTTEKHQGVRLTEKHTLASRERLKPAKLIAQKHKKAEIPRARVNTTDDKISDALLLQSWRAKKWNSSLAELSPAVSEQLPKCMPVVQARLISNLVVSCGKIQADVVDQSTTITLRQFTQGQWRIVTGLLSDRAIFTTSLLNGELPEGIQDVFKQASLSLFPGKIKEFSFECDCNSPMPCEHVCALLLAFALELDEDPFLILTLRGMTRDDLLSQLRDARSDQIFDEKSRNHFNYELPVQNVDFLNYYSANGNFRELSFHISSASNTLIRRLGTPSAWQAPVPFGPAICSIVEAASREAETLSLVDHGAFAEPEEQAPPQLSRAPRNSSKTPKFVMPDLGFIVQRLSPDILETIPDDPVTTAQDIIRWLKTRGASDIRTLARRTRLHKHTIEAFLDAFCEAGITLADGESDKRRFEVTF